MTKETTPEQVMKKLLEEWEDNPLHTTIKAERQGAKILFTSSQGSQSQGDPSRDFRIRVSDGRGDDLLGVVKGAVNKISDLPHSAFDGFTVEVTSGGEDSYYLRFEEKTGTWQETVKPGLCNTLNAKTMPHVLTYHEDGSFVFGPHTWAPRQVGNEDTAPEPSFVGVPIEDLFFYQGRLSILVADSLIFSEVDEWDNFFPTTTATVVESDPVDVTIASGGTTSGNATGGFPRLLYGVEVPRGDLLLFGRHVQYVASVEKTLTPQNLKVALHSHVECAPVRPVSLEQSVVFISPTGPYSQVKEFIPNRSDVSYLLAETLTEHVPDLLPKDIKKLITVNGQKLLLALPHNSNMVYAYFYYWQGEKRLQSAWTRWEFGSPILDICATGQEVWFVFQHGGGTETHVFLEKMTFSPDALCLDHQVRLKGAYDQKTTQTKWTMPHKGADTLVEVWNPLTQKSIPLLTHGRTSLEGRGDHSHQEVVAGLPYSMNLTLGPLVVRQGETGNAGSTMGFGIPHAQVTARQLRLGTEGMQCDVPQRDRSQRDASQRFSVEVRLNGQLQGTYPYEGKSGNALTVPLHGAAEALTITLVHRDARSNGVFTNAVWTGTYGDV